MIIEDDPNKINDIVQFCVGTRNYCGKIIEISYPWGPAYMVEHTVLTGSGNKETIVTEVNHVGFTKNFSLLFRELADI